MDYIVKNLLTEEHILFRTKKHLIIFLYPVILAIFCIFASQYMINNPILKELFWAPWIIAALFLSLAGIEYWFSDFVVTDKRVIMREGFFNRHTTELRINTISQINVDQNLLGQVLDYGTVSINAFGAYDFFTLIAAPIRFQKKVNEMLDKLASK